MVPDGQLIAAYVAFCFITKRLIIRDVRDLWRKNLEVQSLSYSVITMWSLVHYGSVNKLELWTTAGKIGIVTGNQVDVRQLDMLIAMCVPGGVGDLGTTTNPATASNAHSTLS